jgi:hypothetical protein
MDAMTFVGASRCGFLLACAYSPECSVARIWAAWIVKIEQAHEPTAAASGVSAIM